MSRSSLFKRRFLALAERLKLSIYRVFSAPVTVSDLITELGHNSKSIQWVIEAGCHDGSDTQELLVLPNLVKIFAFEPDPFAFNSAEKRFKILSDPRIELYPIALMDKASNFEIFFGENIPGGGSTQVVPLLNSSTENRIIQSSILDSFDFLPKQNGLLWLDVEGNALKVLKGGKSVLRKILYAKVEVEFHNMSITRKKNHFSVIIFMIRSGFIPLKIVIQPSFFGDIFFARRSEVTFNRIVKGYLLVALQILLREIVYPIMQKPKRH